jgi:hypothetical protein
MFIVMEQVFRYIRVYPKSLSEAWLLRAIEIVFLITGYINNIAINFGIRFLISRHRIFIFLLPISFRNIFRETRQLRGR